MKQIFTRHPFTLNRRASKLLFMLTILLASVIDTYAGVVVTIPSTLGTDTTFFTPTNRRTVRSACRMLFTSTEIGITGQVTEIAFQKSSGSSTVSINYIDIYMKETTSTTVSTSVPSLTGYKKVGHSRVLKNDVSSGWVSFSTLSTDLINEEVFTYSGGTNNLDIIIIKSNNETAVSGTDIPIYNCHTASGPVTAYYFGSSALGSSFTGTTTKRPNIKITVENTCAGKPSKGTITSPTSAVCSGGTFSLNPSGLTLGTGMHYQWQSRNAGSGAYSDMSSSDTFTTLSTSQTVNKDYRIVSICTLSGQSDTSDGFTVNTVSPTNITAGSDTTFCLGGSVTLTTPTTTGVTYTWFNGATTTGSTGATYVASASGTYSVRGTTVACPTGVFSNTKTVTVNPLPPTTVTALSSTTFCDGLSVDLQGPAGYNYQWQKGGVDISGATSRVYNATTSGNYRVKVTNATTTCFAYSAATAVTVNPMPAAPVIAGAGGKTAFCTSDNLELSTTAVSGVSYQWENLSGTIAGATSNLYTATSANTYKLAAILGSCIAKSNALVITENTLPIASITPTGAISFCNGDSVEVQATTSADVTYSWQESGTAIPGVGSVSSYYVKTAGVYNVKVTNNTTGCSDKSPNLTVTIISPVVPTISAAGPTTFCTGGDVTLNSVVGSGLLTEWQSGSASIPGATSGTYVATVSGSYRMKVTNGVGCAAYSTPIDVKVNPLPNNSISVTGGTTICNGESSKIMAAVVAGYSYQWQNAGVDIPGETSNPFYAKSNGSYAVHIKDSNGCEATSIPTVITVKFVAPFYIQPYGNTFFCEGEKTKLATQSGFTSYQWYFDGVYIPGATDTFVYATKNGKYSVRVQDPTNSCYATSSGFTILVIPAPDTPFIIKVGTRLSTTVKGVLYQWYRDNVAIAGAKDSFTFVTKPGVYKVVVTNANDCSKEAEIDLSTPTSINGAVSKTDYIKIYPNPTQDRLNVEAPDGITVSLTDMQGRVLFQQKEAKQIDMSQYAQGIYIIKFTDANNELVATEKVSKVDN